MTEAVPVGGDGTTWDVRLRRWPALRMQCEREEVTLVHPDAPRMARFTSVNESCTVRNAEQVTVDYADGGGARITYSMFLGFAGWRRLPCVGASVWAHARADAARAQEKLRLRLAQLADVASAV